MEHSIPPLIGRKQSFGIGCRDTTLDRQTNQGRPVVQVQPLLEVAPEQPFVSASAQNRPPVSASN
jgi:hypothetical protein